MVSTVLDRIGFLLRDQDTRPGRWTNAILYGLNAVFVGLYIASTYDLDPTAAGLVRSAELSLAVVFLGEYVVRVHSADSRRAEITNPYTVVDLVAVLPVLVAPGANVGFLRGLHTLRVFRFLRLLVDEQQFLGRTLHLRSVRRIQISVTIFLIFFITSGFIYAVESPTNSAIGNFGDAFYYTVIAVSTVGFGDITPTTAFGRWVTVVAALVGFVLVPWQATRLRDPEIDADATCGHCGQAVENGDRYCRQCGRELPPNPLRDSE